MIEIQSITPLGIHLVVQGILTWLDHGLNLGHLQKYLPKTGSKHGLDSWLPSWINAGIYANEACTLFDYILIDYMHKKYHIA